MIKNILIVDNDAFFIKGLTYSLKQKKFHVVTATDGLQALDILLTYLPDLIFLDYIMPAIQGDKLCRIIRSMAHLKQCYIVMITAAAPEMEFDYLSFGANACIAKTSFGEMATYIFNVIEHFETHPEQS
ncbi:MAG: response regulator, partial [Desulfobacterales bacterium]|nr:response regulator [Desulfobacterales bacterium]